MVRHFAIIIHEGTLLGRKGGQCRRDMGCTVSHPLQKRKGCATGTDGEAVYNTRCVMPLAEVIDYRWQ